MLEPLDKFGNRIYGKVYRIMMRHGNILINNGYYESKNKPNLFYKKKDDIIIFADLRGTDVIKIWDDQSPLIYSKVINENEYPDWKVTRLLKEECGILNKQGCPTRFSFYSEYEIDGLMSKDEDGYCKICDKDFQDEGKYCSEECENIAKKRELAQYINLMPFCEICKKRIINPWHYEKVRDLLGDDLATISTAHHISYKEDITIIVCSSCHAKIHHSKDPKYTKYQPELKRPEKKSNYYTACEECGGKAKYDKNSEHQICYRCKHKCMICGEFTQTYDKICFNCKVKEKRGLFVNANLKVPKNANLNFPTSI